MVYPHASNSSNKVQSRCARVYPYRKPQLAYPPILSKTDTPHSLPLSESSLRLSRRSAYQATLTALDCAAPHPRRTAGTSLRPLRPVRGRRGPSNGAPRSGCRAPLSRRARIESHVHGPLMLVRGRVRHGANGRLHDASNAASDMYRLARIQIAVP